MTYILGCSGKQGSGKDTLANFLIRNSSELFGEDATVKKYYFAQGLKDLLTDFLNIPKELVWGTDDDKNKATHILWENLPHYQELENEERIRLFNDSMYPGASTTIEEFEAELARRRPKGAMTVRQVLEHVGTEIFRRMYPRVWIERCLNTIRKESPTLAVIADLRFPDEADAIREAGGKLIRLTRTTERAAQNTHASNVALDDYGSFDAYINNAHFNIDETNNRLVGWLKHWGWVKGKKMKVNLFGTYLDTGAIS